MDARTAAAQPQTTGVRREIALFSFGMSETGIEVEVPVDAVALGVTKDVDLIVAVPAGSSAATVRRMVWTVPVGGVLPAEAWSGQYVGDLSPNGHASGFEVSVVFLETQGHAVERARHTRRR